jgi:uncharacterized membrane protein YjgN (DUF898 family)
MKNYFKFSLTGKKLLPIWILFLLLFIVPYSVVVFQLNKLQPGMTPPLYFFPVILLEILVAFFLAYYITKLTIENLEYKDKSVVFTGGFGKFVGVILLGLLLSIITVGIYSPWYVRDINRFFVNNSSYNSQNFEFKGKGGVLLLIILLSVILPMVVITFLFSKSLVNYSVDYSPATVSYQLLIFIILIPYMYFIYKWMVDLNYKNYTIKWETNFWNSCGKILLEIILSLITLGIYMPLAMIRLYKYFVQRTVATGADSNMRFGYDLENLNDFLFIWGQLLLTMITLGIYYPWAFCKIGARILRKTYLEKV